MKVDLSASEASHILTLLQDNETEGSYYGNRAQYERQRERVRAKLLAALHAKDGPK